MAVRNTKKKSSRTHRRRRRGTKKQGGSAASDMVAGTPCDATNQMGGSSGPPFFTDEFSQVRPYGGDSNPIFGSTIPPNMFQNIGGWMNGTDYLLKPTYGSVLNTDTATNPMGVSHGHSYSMDNQTVTVPSIVKIGGTYVDGEAQQVSVFPVTSAESISGSLPLQRGGTRSRRRRRRQSKGRHSARK